MDHFVTRALAATAGGLGSEYLWLPVIGGFAMFYMAWGIGANDVANAFATSWGAKSLTLKQIVIVATICEFCGALLLGSHVSSTIRKGIVDIDAFPGDDGRLEIMTGMLSALLAGGTWLLIATKYSLPVSTTHTIVGSVIGMVIVGRGYDAVVWSKVVKIVLSWFISPLLAMGISGTVWACTKYTVFAKDIDEAESVKRAKVAIPFLTFLTFTICVMFMIYKGGPALKLKSMSVASAIGWGALVGGVFLFVSVFLLQKLIPQWEAQAEAEVASRSEEGQQVTAKDTDVNTDATVPVKQHEVAGQLAVQEPKKASDVGEPEVAKTAITTATVTEKETIGQGKDWDETIRSADEPTTANGMLLEKMFRPLNILTAAFESFAHGANDVANAIGPFNAIVAAYNAPLASKVDMPLWILSVGGIGIVVGLWMYGTNVMKTMGKNITYLSPARAFCIELGATFTILLATNMGMPVSTTHASVGAVLGIGCVDNIKKVKWGVMGSVFASWIVTLPVAALTTSAFYGFLKPTVVNMS